MTKKTITYLFRVKIHTIINACEMLPAKAPFARVQQISSIYPFSNIFPVEIISAYVRSVLMLAQLPSGKLALNKSHYVTGFIQARKQGNLPYQAKAPAFLNNFIHYKSTLQMEQ